MINRPNTKEILDMALSKRGITIEDLVNYTNEIQILIAKSHIGQRENEVEGINREMEVIYKNIIKSRGAEAEKKLQAISYILSQYFRNMQRIIEEKG